MVGYKKMISDSNPTVDEKNLYKKESFDRSIVYFSETLFQHCMELNVIDYIPVEVLLTEGTNKLPISEFLVMKSIYFTLSCSTKSTKQSGRIFL